MKAEITQNKKAFEPIEVKITIESLEELAELCARFALLPEELNKHIDDYGIIKEDSTNDFYELLHNLYFKYK